MTRLHRLLLLFPSLLLAPVTARASDLALARVMLSSGGVGYVEYAADVAGATTLGIDVPLDQVDDVLKSLVVFDGAGGVGGFTLPGRDNVRAAFAEVPFGPEALDSPLAYLNSLRGVTIEVVGPRPMTGQVMRAETVQERAGTTGDALAQRTRITLMTVAGLRQFILEDAETIQVADADLRQRIGRSLEAMRRDAGQTTRHLTLRTQGEGKRVLRVGYVAAAPLWKVSYRLVMPGQGAAKARLQGWAVLENATGADWNGVELALQYGNPVTFRQAIYRSYFVQRPEVPVEVLGRLLPGVDTGARQFPPPPPVPALAPAPSSVAMRGGTALAKSAAGMPANPVAEMAAPSETVDASEGAQETVFVLPGKVVLAAGHTASMPILDREAKAQRVYLVQPRRPHPLAAIRLTNDTPTTLPAGVLTLYDPTSPAMFAGDARLGGLPAGESRLLSFAEDLRSTVTWTQTDATTIAAVTAAAGVLHVDERLRWTTRVTLAAPAAEPREMLVEIPKQPGASPVPGDADHPSEETATAWRYTVALKPGETRTLTVHADRINREQVALLDNTTIVVRLLAAAEVDAKSKAALQRLADLYKARTARRAELDKVNAQFDQIEHDQDRIRQNLAAVPSNDALHGRLVRSLEALEGRIDALHHAAEQAKTAVDRAQQELETAILQFTL